MSNREIYEYRFNELLMLYKRNPAITGVGKEEMRSGYVIDICGDAYRKYSRIVDNNESWVIYAIQKIAMNLMDSYKMNYSIPKYEENSPSGRKRLVHPFAFVRDEEMGKIAYIFSYGLKRGLADIHNSIKQYQDIDGIRIYFMSDDGHDRTDMLNDIENEKYNSFICFAEIADFFIDVFGQEEYELFAECASLFNEKARTLIGLSISEMPTGKAVEDFRKDRTAYLEQFDYEALLPTGITAPQRKIIKDNFMSGKRYELMTCVSDKCSFADSFISSEWYYKQSTTAGALEQTGIVVGYLKSVEQLLYTLLKNWAGRNIWIKINGKYFDEVNNKGLGRGKDNTLIDFYEKYDEYIDKTLGALIHFIKLKKKDGTFKNGNMFCVDESTLQCIIDVLYDFKDVERNDRLHQHNLYTKEAVEEIRNQAFLLYYLLLGSFDLTPKYLSDLGLNANNEKGKVIDEDVLEKQIIEWVTPIVKFDVPQNADVIAFNITKFQGKPWHLALQALGETDYEKYSTIEWNHNMVYTSTITNNVIEWNSEEAWIDGVDKLKRIINKLLENTDISGRLKTYSEVLLGSTEVIDTMYKK